MRPMDETLPQIQIPALRSFSNGKAIAFILGLSGAVVGFLF